MSCSQQTHWFAREVHLLGEKMAEAEPEAATYDDGTDTLIMKVSVKNTNDSPITVKQYIMAMTTFVNGSADEQANAGPHDDAGQLRGRTGTHRLRRASTKPPSRWTNPILTDERLIPLRDPQQFIAGLLRFENALGKTGKWSRSGKALSLRSSVLSTSF